MELREFAEQVLFATDLEAKLGCPAVLTDEHPGPALLSPVAPGRPGGLEFKPSGGSDAGFPGLHRMRSDVERGRLLHFFANHELLATELMALVLLKFPDAPPAFRRGVLQTLRDEQEHTRLYLERMKAYGVRFGDLPVSGYFWRVVAPMESPLDFVSSLSLTFEQANLDFCRMFGTAFAEAGDPATASLLDRIHHDEIAHVAHGLKWFRRWKQPGETDWDAFCRQLKFPLSPQRAKGPMMNLEARRAAGLDAGFIDGLQVFSQSRGRTPTVLWFNPFSEAVQSFGPRFTPVKRQQQLAADLACLPMFLGRKDDVVLTPSLPSQPFLAEVQRAGFALPEFVLLHHGGLPKSGSLRERKLGRLRPWAWGPDSLNLLAPLLPQVTGEARTVEHLFNPQIGRLFGKDWSACFLRDFLASEPGAPWLCGQEDVGTEARTRDEALNAVERIRRRGHHRVVIKQVLGLAGQGMIRLWEPALLESQLRWMEGALAGGHRVVVEPWHERLIDFSIQLEMEESGLRLVGYTGLSNTPQGQFQSNWGLQGMTGKPPAEVASLLHAHRSASREAPWLGLLSRLFRSLARELEAISYRGPLGIDAFVYRDTAGGVRLKPVVEINPRHTMGRLTLELLRNVAPGSMGRFQILSLEHVLKTGASSFPQFALAQRAVSPVQLSGAPRARIQSGWVALNDPEAAQAYLAVFQVSPGSSQPGRSPFPSPRHSS